MSFKVGDRVRVKGGVSINGVSFKGEIGVINHICASGDVRVYCKEVGGAFWINEAHLELLTEERPKLDRFILEGLCPVNYGFWVDEENLELPTEERPKLDRFIFESDKGDYLFTRKDDFQGVPVYRKEKLNRNLCKHKGTCKDHIGDAGIQCNPANCGRYEL